MQYDLSQPILSEGVADAAQIDAWFHSKNPIAPPLGDAILAAHVLSGVNQDFLAAEIGDESNYWKSDRATQSNNPSGLGATDSGAWGEVFDTPADGIRATVAHWRTYTDGASNPLAQYDPRYAVLLTTGKAGTVSTVGQIGAGIWASAPDYNTSVLTRMNDLVANLQPKEPPVPGSIPKPDWEVHHTDQNLWTASSTPTPYLGRGAHPIRAIVCHVAEGTFMGSISWAANPASNASFNYIVAKDGRRAEVVDPLGPYAPWGNGIEVSANTDLPPGLADLKSKTTNANFVTVSIEHEGDYDDPHPEKGAPYDQPFPTETQWQSSIHLAAWLCQEHNLIPSADTIVRHTVFDTVNRPNCPGPQFDIERYRADVAALLGGSVPVPTPPPIVNDPTNPVPLPPDAPGNDPGGVAMLQAKMVEIAYNAVGQTHMGGPGDYIQDGNGPHTPAYWCEAFAETDAAMATGERVRFASAEVHYQHAKANGYLQTTMPPEEGSFVFNSWPGNPDGHIRVMARNGNCIGTVISPDAILEEPLNRYTNVVGWCHPEAVIDAAKTLPPVDPNGGGLGRRDPDGNRVFVWIKDPDTGKAVGLGGGFRDNWEGEGGPNNAIIRLGYPIINERDGINDHGEQLVIEWCERARLEYHKPTGEITRGRLGFEWLQYQKSVGAPLPPDVAPTTDAISSIVTSYWQTHGGLPVFGYPLTEFGALPESTFQGQVFERCILESHPADEAIGWPTQARLIGAELMGLYRAGKIQISG